MDPAAGQRPPPILAGPSQARAGEGNTATRKVN